MNIIERIYINGAFVTPHGEELFDLFDERAKPLFSPAGWPAVMMPGAITG